MRVIIILEILITEYFWAGGRNLDFKAEETTEFGQTKIVQDQLKTLLQQVILPKTPFEIERSWSGIMGVGTQKRPIIKQLSTHVLRRTPWWNGYRHWKRSRKRTRRFGIRFPIIDLTRFFITIVRFFKGYSDFFIYCFPLKSSKYRLTMPKGS